MRLADREMRDSSRQVHYRFISCCKLARIGTDWHELAPFPQPDFVALGSNAMLGEFEAWPDKGTFASPALTGTTERL